MKVKGKKHPEAPRKAEETPPEFRRTADPRRCTNIVTLCVVNEPEEALGLVEVFSEGSLPSLLQVVADHPREAIEDLKRRLSSTSRLSVGHASLVLLEVNPARAAGKIVGWIKMQPELAALPVFCVVRPEDARWVEALEKAGAEACLIKPAAFKEWVAQIRSTVLSLAERLRRLPVNAD